MKRFILFFLTLFFLTACTPGIGIGVGGFAASGNGVAASEIHADSQTGVHGSVAMGTDINL